MSETERERLLEVLHASICNCDQGVPTGGYIVRATDALIAAGFGDVTALDVSPRDRVTIASLIADLHRVTAERDALAAKVAAVEAMHHSDYVDADVVVHYWCAECGDDFPCATSRALSK